MFLVPDGYGSAGLSHIFVIACVAFYFIYSYIDIYILQTTYRHRLECDEGGMLTRSNYARHGD